MRRKNKNIKIIFKYVIAPALAAWLFYSLYKQIKEQPDLTTAIEIMKHAPFGQQGWKVWGAVLLIFANWGIEARKWQILMKPLQPLTYYTAFKSVLSGVTLSINTPNRIGEYGGRILFVQPGKRIKAISLSIAGSISQLIITMVTGCAGLYYLINFQITEQETIMGLNTIWLQTLFIICLAATVLLVLFFFKLSWLIKMIEKIPAAAKFVKYVAILDSFSPNLLLRLLSLSFFRYTIFVIQYILLLQVLDVNITWLESFYILSILFLVMAVIPSFAIADLGIRGKFSTQLLGLFSNNFIGIIGTTFGIWFINLFVPALLGSIFILGIKFFKENHQT